MQAREGNHTAASQGPQTMRRGLLRMYCFQCLCEWLIDVEEFKPGDWRAVDPDDRVDMDRCDDCGSMLHYPERVEGVS